ncbi:MAG: hypothetical protein EAY75_08295 [Bacteroidetes bacterium]|nr:MAG: hypothetical protein EAY75_08295 [Bacteroidota bacterium]
MSCFLGLLLLLQLYMKTFVSFLALLVWLVSAGQQPFTPGSIVVVRVGSPEAPLPAGTSAVFIEEYNAAGRHLQTIAIPSLGPDKLTLGGRSVTEGVLKRSQNGAFLTLGGYNLEPGVSNPTATTTGAERVVARVNAAGLVDLSNKVPVDSLYPNAAFRAVVSNNGNQFWTAGGTQGVRYFAHGSTQTTLISSTITNLRSLDIQNGNLFLSHASGTVSTRLMQVGVGLPDVPGIVAAALPGLPTTSSSVGDFFFADVSADVEGPDVLYLADELSGLRKYSLVAGSWVLNNTVGGAGDLFRGLAGIQIPNGAILYASIRASNQAAGGGQLVRIIDMEGYNNPMPSEMELFAQAATNTGFRGVALSPFTTATPAVTYVFIGNGNWSNPQNWQNNHRPPAILPSGSIILISPVQDGVCVVDVQQTIDKGGIYLVGKQKKVLISGSLELR